MTIQTKITTSEVRRIIALTLAVLHHGSSNLSVKAVPTGRENVVKTADLFDKYIEGGEVPRGSRS